MQNQLKKIISIWNLHFANKKDRRKLWRNKKKTNKTKDLKKETSHSKNSQDGWLSAKPTNESMVERPNNKYGQEQYKEIG